MTVVFNIRRPGPGTGRLLGNGVDTADSHVIPGIIQY